MKRNRLYKVIVIIASAIIIIGAIGFVIWAKTGTLYAREIALSALESTDEVVIKQEKWIIFDPAKEEEIGLIFYPGGLVEPKAYAPILKELAEESVMVVITPMPLNLAILNTGAANAVIDSYPEVSNWIIAGHSLGGASAAIFAENNPDRIVGIAVWDSYPPNSADLSNISLRAISIFGTSNGIPNTDNFNQKRDLMPVDTLFVGIEGANHAQFGDYGPQKGDVEATLSLTEQHKLVAEIMLDFLFQKE